MKLFNQVRKYGPRAALGSVGALVVSAPAFAAIDETVTTAMTTLKTDVGTLAAAAFAVLLVIVAYRYFRRAT